MNAAVALVAGLLFGAGLLVSGMSDPRNVLTFLNLGSGWSPSLAFTMAAAIAIALPAFTLARRAGRTLRGTVVALRNDGKLDLPLLWGSTVFGIGWGLTGICPGPGLLLIATGTPNALVFGIGYVVGVYAVDSFAIGTRAAPSPPSSQSATLF